MIRSALFVLVALAGCTPPCSQLCVNMADYAEECGFPVGQADIDACQQEQADSDLQKSCRLAGDPETLRNEWSCDEVGIFFN